MIKKIQYACLISSFMCLAFPSHETESKTPTPLERSDPNRQKPNELDQKTKHEAEMKRDQLDEQLPEAKLAPERGMLEKNNGTDIEEIVPPRP